MTDSNKNNAVSEDMVKLIFGSIKEGLGDMNKTVNDLSKMVSQLITQNTSPSRQDAVRDIIKSIEDHFKDLKGTIEKQQILNDQALTRLSQSTGAILSNQQNLMETSLEHKFKELLEQTVNNHNDISEIREKLPLIVDQTKNLDDKISGFIWKIGSLIGVALTAWGILYYLYHNHQKEQEVFQQQNREYLERMDKRYETLLKNSIYRFKTDQKSLNKIPQELIPNEE